MALLRINMAFKVDFYTVLKRIILEYRVHVLLHSLKQFYHFVPKHGSTLAKTDFELDEYVFLNISSIILPIFQQYFVFNP